MPTPSAHAARPARPLPLALLIIATLCLTLIVPAAPARAAGPFVVNVNTDAAPAPPNGTCSAGLAHECTLREAVQEANFAGGATTISFASAISGTSITLFSSLGSLDIIGNSIVIDGTDKNITISGDHLNSSDGVFRIEGNSNTVKNLTIRNAPQDGIQIGDYDLGAGKGNSNSVIGVKLIGNGGAGVYIKSGASGGGNNNIVRASLIGALTAAPSACTPSQGNFYGIAIDPGVIGSQLIGNTIICNATNGVSINGAGSAANSTRTLLYQNLIGVVGSTNLGNGGAGVSIYGDARRIDVFNNKIAGNQQFGVYIVGAATNNIALSGNLIGTSVNGNSAVPNLQAGVQIDSVPNATIEIADANRIAGNGGAGIWIKGSSGVTVKGNYIGTNAAGAALPNTSYGVQLSDGAHDNLIGGSLVAERNIISGNGLSGVYLQGAATAGNQVANNYIGTNAAGSAAIANHTYGVQLADGAHNNTIGGNTAADRNVISGNTLSGVYIQGAATTGNYVAGNYIGTNAAGSAALPNHTHGVQLADGAHDNGITGTISARNLISGNTLSGVYMQGAATAGNQVVGNYIGTNAAGNVAIPNGAHGVQLADGAHDNTIGGSTVVDRNIISGNAHSGVYIQDTATAGNQVDSNYIGLSAAGNAAIANGNAGVTLNRAGNNPIGSAANTSQFISGNAGAGIYITEVISGSIGQSNRIGVGANETMRLGNGDQGVVLTSTLNVSVFAKLIAYNGGAGVAIIRDDSNANTVLPGAIHDNDGLPIDLGDDGPTANDANDADFGPDTLLNYPIITASSGRVITGTVCLNCQVWIYQAIGDAHAPRGGGSYIAHVTAGAQGGWTATLPAGLTHTDVSVIACEAPCDATSNVSEMSPSAPHVKLYLPLLKR